MLTDAAGFAGAGEFGPEERFAEPVEIRGRDAGAAVFDREGNEARFPLGGDGDRTGVAGIPQRIAHEIAEGAGEQPFLDPVTNVRIGAHVLQEAIQRQGGLVDGLQYYAGAVDDEEKTYATKVLAEKQRLEQAAQRFRI